MLTLLLAFMGVACNRDQPADVQTEAPADLVSAHTAGVVSKNSPIQITFSQQVIPEDEVGSSPSRNPFSFEPAIAGTPRWEGRSQLLFQPDAPLKSGVVYTATVDLGAVLSDSKGKAFSFEFGARPNTYWTQLTGLEADGTPEKQRFVGVVEISDEAEDALVEKMLTAKHQDDALSVSWTHEGNGHRFTIAGIERQAQGTQLSLTFDGAPLGIEQSSETSISVPGLHEFLLLSARAEQTGERFIELRFSDPLDPEQDLRGLVQVEGQENPRLVRDGSILRIYASQGWETEATVTITGLKSSLGHPIDEVATVSFAPRNPEVRFVGKGVVLPRTEELTLPIEVVNLTGVTIEAIQVAESNVPQFLQVNAIDGNAEMHRVGKSVWKKHVDLPVTDDQYNRWVNLGLDLDELIEQNPGGLYQIAVGFDRGDIMVDCPGEPWETETVSPFDWENHNTESSFWDLWDIGGGISPWEAWENRDNPCHRGFYVPMDEHNVRVTRNVIVSNLGLVAKRGEDGHMVVAASDLLSARPRNLTQIEVLDYQLRPMVSGVTDADGVVALQVPHKPFAVSATEGRDRAWLRLDHGSALATAHFDVGGTTVTEGVKGYLYGERGVWRPGDDVHLTFVLHDETGKIPADHPIRFELTGPRGQVLETRTIPSSVGGFYRISTGTDPGADPGNYLARVTFGGVTFDKMLRVEPVIPNRLKIDLGVGDERIKELELRTNLAARWLHGAIAGGLEADLQVKYQASTTTFAGWADHVFDDPAAGFVSEWTSMWSGTLDDQGKAQVSAPFEIMGRAPGFVDATLMTRIFEPSGAFSVEQHAVPLSPHQRYVGIKTPMGDKARGMLLTDTKHPIDVVVVDADGQPVQDGEVALALYKLRWRWWWEKGTDDLSAYAGGEEATPLRTGTLSLERGKATWDLEIKYPEWGRYLLVAEDQTGTHRAGKIVYMDWPGWAGRGGKERPGGASVLSLNSDKEQARVGEEVTLTFPMAANGRALVSLETGVGIAQTAWVTADSSGSGRYTFEVSPDMSPSVYANVTVVQPHSSDNDAPIRMVGITGIEVFDPATKLSPVIQTAAVFAPETTATVTVSESAGRAMTYTLAMVDEGLLGLTRYQTPNPWDQFYQREALGVRTWDLYDLVSGAYGSALEGVLGIGGGAEDQPNATPPEAQRFEPLAHYAGPFTLVAGETADHQVSIPQYVGEVRVMVVAGGQGAYGAAEQSVVVKKPLMVLATVPRKVSLTETVTVPVSVFALDDKVKNAKIQVEVEGPISLVTQKAKSLSFDRPGNKMVLFEVQANNAVGPAKLTVRAKGGGESATQTINFMVDNPNGPISEVSQGVAEPGKDWSTELVNVGLPGTNQNVLEVSPVPPLGLEKHLEQLIAYPYGCAEQTTSKAFPQVLLSSVIDLTPAQQGEVKQHVTAALKRLRSMQNGAGGFSVWPGGTSDDWTSSYVGHFLVEAKRAGFLLPVGMESKWVEYQRGQANRWVHQGDRSDLAQAYRLYTLALAGRADLAAMNRLREGALSNTAQWRLAAAYALVGQAKVAQDLTAGLSTEVAPYRELGGTFGSNLRDQALILEAMVLLKRDVGALAETVSKQLHLDGHATQTTAQALVSLVRVAQSAQTGFQFRWSLNGKSTQVSADKAVVAIPITQEGSLEITDASTRLYTQLILTGVPELGSEGTANKGIGLDVRYTTVNGDVIDVSRVDHGADLMAVVTVTNQTGSGLEGLVLNQTLPSGWEIWGEGSGPAEGVTYQEVHDAGINRYFDLQAGASLEFRTRVNAAYRGRFYLPAVRAEAMYDPSIHGRWQGRWIEVTRFLGG